MPLHLPPRARRTLAPPSLRSQSRFRVQYARVSEYGLDALTGQAATFTRASASTILDSAGQSVPIGYSLPCVEMREWFGVSCAGVRYGTGDDCWYPCDLLPECATVLCEGINCGTAQTNGAGLVGIMRDDSTGNRLVVRGTGTTFAVDLIGGATSTATLGAAVASLASFELLVQIDDNGTQQRVRIGGCVNGATVSWSVWGDWITRLATWGTGARLRLNRVGNAGTQGEAWIRQVAWDVGLLDLTTMQERR